MPDLEVPTPSPIPSPPGGPYSLSERINIATRPIHSQLNRLIVFRLPLALPPYTTNSSTYVSGLLHICPIYTTFESLWQTILDTPQLPTNLKQTLQSDACDPGQPLMDSRSVPILPNTESPPLVHTPKVCSRTHSLLSHLRLPGLLRAGRLRADIRVLTGAPEHRIHEQLEAVSRNGRLAAFLVHTRNSVEENPHVLLAYAWVLYMALFSGGRYLRASLKEAGGSGADFWDRDLSPVRPYSITRDISQRRGFRSESSDGGSLRTSARRKIRSESDVSSTIPGMQFFNFIGDEDGEDIKLEFKKRITEAEILLTNGEKEDIIREAQSIFEFMVEMVGVLDAVMLTKEEDLESTKLVQGSRVLMATRDSVTVARERLIQRATLNQEKSRKSSLMDVFACAGKIVHFQGPFPTFKGVTIRSEDILSEKLGTKPLGRDSKSREAYAPVAVFQGVMTFVPLIMLFVMFCAWFHLR